nr:Fic family protein [Methylovulum miyakonense]
MESALGAAEQTWHYTQDSYQAAAQYCYSIARNHPFVDGNKRVAAACMMVFLVANQKQPLITNTELYDWVIQVFTNELTREALADLLAQNCKSN